MDAFFDLMDWGMEKWKRFTALDVAIFKLFLFSAGTLFGMYAVRDRKKLEPLVQTVVLLTFCRLIWRMFGAGRGQR